MKNETEQKLLTAIATNQTAILQIGKEVMALKKEIETLQKMMI